MTASSRLVVDASVGVKWFAPEPLTEEALSIPRLYEELIAPHLIVIEVASALLKKSRRREVDPGRVPAALETLLERVSPIATLGAETDAFDLAMTNRCSLYDAIYLGLAVEEGCQLMTADQKLYNALRSAYPDTVLWLGDVKA